MSHLRQRRLSTEESIEQRRIHWPIDELQASAVPVNAAVNAANHTMRGVAPGALLHFAASFGPRSGTYYILSFIAKFFISVRVWLQGQFSPISNAARLILKCARRDSVSARVLSVSDMPKNAPVHASHILASLSRRVWIASQHKSWNAVHWS